MLQQDTINGDAWRYFVDLKGWPVKDDTMARTFGRHQMSVAYRQGHSRGAQVEQIETKDILDMQRIGQGFTPVAVCFNGWNNRRTRVLIHNSGKVALIE